MEVKCWCKLVANRSRLHSPEASTVIFYKLSPRAGASTVVACNAPPDSVRYLLEGSVRKGGNRGIPRS